MGMFDYVRPLPDAASSRAGAEHTAARGRLDCCGFFGGVTCYVEQGFYGHIARKGTWLYAFGVRPPALRWGEGEQRIHPRALELHGYEKARRIGMMAMVGGKDKKRIRDATPPDFRDLLLSIARTAALQQEDAA